MTNANHVKPFGDQQDPAGFYQLLVAHLNWLAIHNFSAKTIEKRALYVRAFGLWCLQRDLLSPMSIAKPMLEAFQRHLFSYRKPDGKPLAWSSQHLHLKELRQFFAWLAKHNFIPFSPAADLELPKLPRQLPKAVLSDDEVERILQLPDTTTPLGLRDRAIFEVLYSTGIRRAELCSLRIDHIHVDRQVLLVSLGKGQKDRYVPVGLRALTWVARYVEHARDKLCIDPKEQTLFVTIDGTPINPDSLTEYGRRYIKAAGIDKPGACHIFRHTMATLMHDNGADIRTLQAILGHEKLDTTQIYTRVGLKKLLDTHAKTHPAEQPQPQLSPQSQQPDKPSQSQPGNDPKRSESETS
jgi:integrase/recombinase XerD